MKVSAALLIARAIYQQVGYETQVAVIKNGFLHSVGQSRIQLPVVQFSLLSKFQVPVVRGMFTLVVSIHPFNIVFFVPFLGH